MLFFTLWVGAGALAGWFVGIDRCADMTPELPTDGHVLQIGFCAAFGALVGFLVFLILVVLLYAQGIFFFV